MKVVVCSTSRIKLVATAKAFEALGIKDAVCVCVAAESGVGAQPGSTRNMENGARGRIRHALELKPGADYYVAIENGLVYQNDRWFDPACVVVRNAEGRESVAFGAHFPIPTWMVERTLERKSELGVIVQELAGGGEKDPMAYLSQSTISREELLAQAVCCTLAPLLNKERYVNRIAPLP